MNFCTFPQRLRQAINSGSVNAFAIKCGIPESLLRKYVGGKSKPGMDNLITMANVADVNINWLATGEGPMQYTPPPKGVSEAVEKMREHLEYLAIESGIESSTNIAEYNIILNEDREREIISFVESLAAIVFHRHDQLDHTSPPINIELLQRAIEVVDDVLNESNRELASDKKAQLIGVVYDMYSESEEKPEKGKILQLVKLAA